MTGKIAKRLADLNIELPAPRAPVANYVPAVKTGNHIYIAGQVSVWNGEYRHLGHLGGNVSVEQGQEAARLCGLNIIAQLQAALGDLDRVRQCVKVANGASDLIVQVFGETGRHARSAVGVAALPLGVSVEVDAAFEFA
jgi:enamine deaminase RidA (YjgF/YER057c/UK114 family)